MLFLFDAGDRKNIEKFKYSGMYCFFMEYEQVNSNKDEEFALKAIEGQELLMAAVCH